MGLIEKFKDQYEKSQRNAVYGVHRIVNDEYVYLPKGKFKSVKKPIAGAVAEFDPGVSSSSATATRVIAGALIAGPVGAVVGGLFQKQKGRCYVYVTFADDAVAIVDGPIGDASKLREFTLKINEAAKYHADQ